MHARDLIRVRVYSCPHHTGVSVRTISQQEYFKREHTTNQYNMIMIITLKVMVQISALYINVHVLAAV